VIALCPYSDFSGIKARPAIVISNNYFNSITQDCFLAPLTTNLKDRPYFITLYPDDVEEGNIISASSIRVDKIFSSRKTLVKEKIGSVSKAVFQKIKQLVHETL